MGTETLWEGANQEPARRPGRLRAWASASGPTTPRPGELVGVEGTWIEGLLGAVSGFAFGFVGTSLGHPADTIKTKMQVLVCLVLIPAAWRTRCGARSWDAPGPMRPGNKCA